MGQTHCLSRSLQLHRKRRRNNFTTNSEKLWPQLLLLQSHRRVSTVWQGEPSMRDSFLRWSTNYCFVFFFLSDHNSFLSIFNIRSWQRALHWCHPKRPRGRQRLEIRCRSSHWKDSSRKILERRVLQCFGSHQTSLGKVWLNHGRNCSQWVADTGVVLLNILRSQVQVHRTDFSTLFWPCNRMDDASFCFEEREWRRSHCWRFQYQPYWWVHLRECSRPQKSSVTTTACDWPFL